MKKWKALLFAGIMLSCPSLRADYDTDDVSQQEITSAEDDNGPFKIRASIDWLGKAKFDDDDASGHIRYTHAEVEFDTVVWYNECYREGVNVGLAYEYTKLNWDDNPFFERKHYDTAVVNATYFTHRLCDWYWIASVAMNIDADKWNLTDYLTWDMMIWGRYQYCRDIGLHAGIYAETGMKLDRVLPVLGFDWLISNCWKLNAVFPMNMSLVYTVDENWNIALAGRIFSDRHRAGRKGEREKAVWRYSSAGAELAVSYNMCNWLITNVHAGYDFGGHLKVANRHSHNSKRFRFKNCPYFGGELAVSF